MARQQGSGATQLCHAENEDGAMGGARGKGEVKYKVGLSLRARDRTEVRQMTEGLVRDRIQEYDGSGAGSRIAIKQREKGLIQVWGFEHESDAGER